MPYREANKTVRCYLVDDDPDSELLMEDVVKNSGIDNYVFYKCPLEFLNDLGEEAGICAIDHYLPGITGLELLKKVKNKNSASFVIGVSGHSNCDLYIDYINADVDRYVKKDGDGEYREKLLMFLQEGLTKAKDRIEYQYFMHHKVTETLKVLGET